jgi:hypothetical protein
LSPVTSATVDIFLAASSWGLKRSYSNEFTARVTYADFEVGLTAEQRQNLRWVFVHLSKIRSQLTDMPGEVAECFLSECTPFQDTVRTNQIADLVNANDFVASLDRDDEFLNERPIQLVFPEFAVVMDGHHRSLAETMATGSFTGHRVRAEVLCDWLLSLPEFVADGDDYDACAAAVEALDSILR